MPRQRITVPEVFVVDAEGRQLGLMPTYDAFALAEGQGLELVMVDMVATTPSWRLAPVFRMMDFARFKYLNRRKTRAQFRGRSTRLREIKEFYLGAKIAPRDLTRKIAQLREFIALGHPCWLVVLLDDRGAARAAAQRSLGRALLDRIVGAVADVGAVEGALPAEQGDLTVTLVSRLLVKR